MMRALRIEADRHVGADRRAPPPPAARSSGAKTVGAREQPQRRRRIGRAAAEAGRDRNVLLKQKAPGLEPGDALAQRGERFEHQIVGNRPACGGERPGDVERGIAARLQAERVGEVGEGHQAFKLVIAVGAAAEHAQCQIDLGGSLFDQRRVTRASRRRHAQPPSPLFLPALACDEVSSGSPFLSLASIFGRSSGSGLRSRACAHWNLASSTRPTRQ